MVIIANINEEDYKESLESYLSVIKKVQKREPTKLELKAFRIGYRMGVRDIQWKKE